MDSWDSRVYEVLTLIFSGSNSIELMNEVEELIEEYESEQEK